MLSRFQTCWVSDLSLKDIYGKVDEEINRYRNLGPGLLRAVEPVNLQEEKRKFLESQSEPKFKYPVVFFNPKDIINGMKKIHVPEGELHEPYAMKVEEIINLAKMVESRGGEDFVEHSIKVYGKPTNLLVREALKIIKSTRISEKRGEKTIFPASKLRETLENSLENYNLRDWLVEYTNKSLVTVLPAERRILVPRERFFSRRDLKRLVVHEIGVHVLRAENGYSQPLSVFVSGFPNYMETEEGLAAYMERFTGLMENKRLLIYAARVISVHLMLRGMKFSEVFHNLKELGFDDEEAWTLTFRSFRGGGLTKDYLYFKGSLEMRKIARKRAALNVLYCGKVSHQYFDLILNLLENREINKPKILPKGVRSLNKLENLLKNVEVSISKVLRNTRKAVMDDEISKIASDIGSAIRKWKAAFRSRV